MSGISGMGMAAMGTANASLRDTKWMRQSEKMRPGTSAAEVTRLPTRSPR